LASVFYNLYLHPLRKYPGPRSLASSDLLYALSIIRGNSITKLKHLHDVYGPVVRFGPNRLSFDDPAAFKDIYGHRQGRQNLQKDMTFYSYPPNGAPGIIVPDDANHSRMRRYIAHAFSAKALEEQQYIVKEYIDMFIKGLRERAGQEVDMVAWYNWTTFDVIGKSGPFS